MAVEDPEGGALMENRFEDLPPDVREHILERLNKVLEKMADVTKEVTTALQELGALVEEISRAGEGCRPLPYGRGSVRAWPALVRERPTRRSVATGR